MEQPKVEPTLEQQKEIKKILFQSKVSLVGASIKFAIGLFSTNLIAILIGAYILKSEDPDTQKEMQAGFQFVAMVVNFIFMTRYFSGQTKKINDRVTDKIKDILKNDKT